MNVFELMAKIGIDTSKYDEGLNNAEKKGKSFASNLGKAITTGVKIVGAASVAVVGAASTGISKLTTQAVKAYGDYEQLVGGVEKLFGDSASIVNGYARQAYQSAGLSANEYMETVTSFSAALINNLGGDTKKAADLADVAIRDMSDNANVFGSDIQSIMAAYQGFSKQNYTLLDNLKLGYGGTKSEVERLIRDAEKLDSTFSVTHKKTKKGADEITYGYADIVKAIHIVQTEMNITGTTSREASSTIQGSIGQMKSAWQNLITGLGDPNQLSMKPLIDNVVQSALTVVQNIRPIAQQAIKGIVQLVEGIAPILASEIPTLIEEVLPPLISTVTILVERTASILPSLIESTLPSIVSAITSVVMALVRVMPQILSVLSSLLPSILQELIPAILTLLPLLVRTGLQFITAIGRGLADNIDLLMDAVMKIIHFLVDELLTPNNIAEFIHVALEIILAIASGILKNIPEILGAIAVLVWNIIQGIGQALPDIGLQLIEFIVGLGDQLGDLIYSWIGDAGLQILNNISEWVSGIFAWFSNKANAFLEGLVAFLNSIISFIENPKESIKNALEAIRVFFVNGFTAIRSFVSNTFSNIKNTINSGMEALKTLIPKAIEFVKSSFVKGFDAIKEKVTTVFDNLKKAAESVMTFLKNVFSGEWKLPKIKLPHFKIEGKFNLDPKNFSVPKIAVEWYAKAMNAPYFLDKATIFGESAGRLLGGGESGSELVVGTNRLMSMMSETVKRSIGKREPTNITVNVYGAEGQDVRELAKAVSKEMQYLINDQEAAYGLT